MLFDVGRLPRVANPLIAYCASGHVAALVHHILWKSALLWLIFVLFFGGEYVSSLSMPSDILCLLRSTHMQHKDAEFGLSLNTELLPCGLNILLQFLHSVLEGGASVVDFIDNQNFLANQILHFAETREIKPLGAGDLLARLLDNVVCGELLVERQANGLDGNVGHAGLLEEGSQNTRGYIATTADGNHQLRLMVVEYVLSRLLTELMDLEGTSKSAEICTIAGRAQNATGTKINQCIGKEKACDFLYE